MPERVPLQVLPPGVLPQVPPGVPLLLEVFPPGVEVLLLEEALLVTPLVVPAELSEVSALPQEGE